MATKTRCPATWKSAAKAVVCVMLLF